MSKVNIVMLVADRPRLTEQALRSLYENTPEDQFNLVCVDDGSKLPWMPYDLLAGSTNGNNFLYTLSRSIGIVGFLRNIGAAASERHFGRGEYLMFVDNDVAFFPNWLGKMILAKEHVTFSENEASKGYSILGGCRHPYHGVNHISFGPGVRVEQTDAVAGYSMLMTWSTWDRMGPFPDNQKGVGASEDFALCQRVIQAKGYVGYVDPPVLAHCGIKNTNGQPATGAEAFKRVEGILYE